MKNRRKNNKKLLLILLILGVSIGFALLSTTLGIVGISGIKKNTWNIHWDDTSIQETEGSVTATSPARVTDTEKKNIAFTVDFELPGEYYEFTADAINEGSINGKIESVQVKFYEQDGTTLIDPADLPAELVYSITHADGTALTENEIISKNGGKIGYKFKIGVDPNTTTLPDPIEIITVVEVTSSQTSEETGHQLGEFVWFDPVNYGWCEEGDGGTCYKWYVVNKDSNYYDLYMYEHMTNSKWNQTNPVDCIKSATTSWSNNLWIDPKYDYQVSNNFNLDFSTAKARLLTSQEYNALPANVISSIYAYDQIQQNNSMLIDYETQQFKWDGPTEAASSGIAFTAGISTGFYIHPVIHVAKNNSSVSDACKSYNLGKVVYFDPVSNSTCDANTYNVNAVKAGTSTCYRWRTIKNEANCEVTLQLDHNIVNRASWTTRPQANEDKGPDNILTLLQQATSTWTRVPLLNYIYDTSDVVPVASNEVSCQNPNDSTKLNRCYYGSLICTNGNCNIVRYNETIFSVNNMRARAITAEEVRDIVNTKADSNAFSQTWTLAKKYNQGSFVVTNTNYQLGSHFTSGTGSTELSWLLENTWYSDESNLGVTASDFYDGTDATYNAGYWTLSPTADNDNFAWEVGIRDGALDWATAYNWNGAVHGIRPVITIDKNLVK